MSQLIKNRFSFCKNLFIAITFLCAVNTFPRTMTSSQERQREMQREGTQAVDLVENEINNVPDLYTQTQAHERLRKMRTLIQENFSKRVVPYFNIISRMVTKEAELKDTHYVFYHTTATMHTVLSDLFTQLYAHFHPEAKATDDTFRFLRFQGQSTKMSAREFLLGEMRTNFLVDDKDPDKRVSNILLSVNLSLFGSTGSQTESTWLRFLDNRRTLSKPGVAEGFIEVVLDEFGLTKKYVKEIKALDDNFAVTPEAAMVQICIPKNKVDQLVYLAWIRGIPATGPIIEWIKKYHSSKAVPKDVRGDLEHIYVTRQKLAATFKEEQRKNPMYNELMKDLESGEFSAYAFLRAYCSKPSEVPYLNDTQGRILFSKEGMLNPSSGIKFYYYYSTPREKLEEYTTKLNAIVKKLIAEKEAGVAIPVPMPKPTPKPKPTPTPMKKPIKGNK